MYQKILNKDESSPLILQEKITSEMVKIIVEIMKNCTIGSKNDIEKLS